MTTRTSKPKAVKKTAAKKAAVKRSAPKDALSRTSRDTKEVAPTKIKAKGTAARKAAGGKKDLKELVNKATVRNVDTVASVQVSGKGRPTKKKVADALRSYTDGSTTTPNKPKATKTPRFVAKVVFKGNDKQTKKKLEKLIDDYSKQRSVSMPLSVPSEPVVETRVKRAAKAKGASSETVVKGLVKKAITRSLVESKKSTVSLGSVPNFPVKKPTRVQQDLIDAFVNDVKATEGVSIQLRLRRGRGRIYTSLYSNAFIVTLRGKHLRDQPATVKRLRARLSEIVDPTRADIVILNKDGTPAKDGLSLSKVRAE